MGRAIVSILFVKIIPHLETHQYGAQGNLHVPQIAESGVTLRSLDRAHQFLQNVGKHRSLVPEVR